jgi:hypothetical protein
MPKTFGPKALASFALGLGRPWVSLLPALPVGMEMRLLSMFLGIAHMQPKYGSS